MIEQHGVFVLTNRSEVDSVRIKGLSLSLPDESLHPLFLSLLEKIALSGALRLARVCPALMAVIWTWKRKMEKNGEESILTTLIPHDKNTLRRIHLHSNIPSDKSETWKSLSYFCLWSSWDAVRVRLGCLRLPAPRSFRPPTLGLQWHNVYLSHSKAFASKRKSRAEEI